MLTGATRTHPPASGQAHRDERAPDRAGPPEPTAQATHATELLGLILVLVVALLVRLGPLQRGLGFDELFTAVHFIETQTAWQTASSSINFNNHVAFSLLARLTEGLLGRSEWALRLPALLLGLCSLVVLWWLARPVVGGWLALGAAALVALAPEHVRWSTSARGYAGLILGVLMMAGLLSCLLKRPAALSAIGLAVTTALAAYFHLYAAAVAVVQGALLLGLLSSPRLDPTPRRGVVYALAALTGAGLLSLLLYLPILGALLRSVQDGGQGTFRPGLAWSVAREMTAASPDWMVGLTLLVSCVGVLRVYRTHPLIAVQAVSIAVVPVLAVILARPLDQYARFFSYIVPFLLTALVAGATAPVALLRRRLPPRLFLLSWLPPVAIAVLLLWSWSTIFADFRVDEGFRDAVRALEADAPESASLCALGAGAELFQWYASRSLALPKTVNEFQQVARRTPKPRCVYRPASWESRSSAELRRYVEERSTAERFGDIVVYRVRRGQ